MNVKQLHEMAEHLFGKRTQLLSLWQEIGDNFYPERADFTASRTLGEDFASGLATSYPLIARRDLGNAFSTMLRPTQKEWFHIVATDSDDNEGRRWLEWASAVMRRAMYDRVTQFVRATKEGDHDFAAFGQAVLSVELNRNRDALLYRCWHLRDVAWQENENGAVGCVFRKWKPCARDLIRIFGSGRVHERVLEMTGPTRDPFGEVECMHMVVDSEMVDGKWNTPYVSIYYDVQNKHEIEKVGVFNPSYVIPRWQTVSGSQYAYSPATVAALPDARLIQAMTATLLEAGEKMTNPPMIAVKEAIRSDISIYAGGITWVDRDYDEKLGEVLRPLTQDKSGMPLGIEMQRDARLMISDALFLNKLNLPQRASGMSEYEIAERIQEYIRNAMPLFEPMEMDYNGGLCEATFDTLLRGGAFGDPRNMPRSLQGAEVQFRFESPLHDAVEKQKSQKWLEAKQILADAMALDQTAIAMVDAKTALRDVLNGIGVPAKWLRSESELQAMEEQQAEQQQAEQMLQQMHQGSEIAANLGKAEQAMSAVAA